MGNTLGNTNCEIIEMAAVLYQLGHAASGLSKAPTDKMLADAVGDQQLNYSKISAYLEDWTDGEKGDLADIDGKYIRKVGAIAMRNGDGTGYSILVVCKVSTANTQAFRDAIG